MREQQYMVVYIYIVSRQHLSMVGEPKGTKFLPSDFLSIHAHLLKNDYGGYVLCNFYKIQDTRVSAFV